MPDVGTRKQVTMVDSVDVTAEVSTAVFRSAETDSDFVSFADAAAGGRRDYVFAATMKQNTSTGTMWSIVWGQSGAEVKVVIWPHGMPVDEMPTTDQPSFTATAVVQDPDGDMLGGEANRSASARQVTEVEWLCTAKPVKDDGSV